MNTKGISTPTILLVVVILAAIVVGGVDWWNDRGTSPTDHLKENVETKNTPSQQREEEREVRSGSSGITDPKLVAELSLLTILTPEAQAWFKQSIEVRAEWPATEEWPNKYF